MSLLQHHDLPASVFILLCFYPIQIDRLSLPSEHQHFYSPLVNLFTGKMIHYAFSILYSVQFSLSVLSDSLWPHGLQQARLSCPSPSPGAYSDSCPLRWWCHPTFSPSVVPHSVLFSIISLRHKSSYSSAVHLQSCLPLLLQLTWVICPIELPRPLLLKPWIYGCFALPGYMCSNYLFTIV